MLPCTEGVLLLTARLECLTSSQALIACCGDLARSATRYMQALAEREGLRDFMVNLSEGSKGDKALVEDLAYVCYLDSLQRTIISS